MQTTTKWIQNQWKAILLIFALLSVSALLLTLTFDARAQEETPEPNPVEVIIGDEVNPVPSDTIFEFFDSILNSFLLGAVPLVVVLTQVAKRTFPDLGIKTIRLVLTVIFWGVFIVLNITGYTAQFEALVPAISSILATVFGIALTPGIAGAAFDKISEGGVPLLGWSRSEPEVLEVTSDWRG